MLDSTCHIVFATNFSDACHGAIPAVARWVDQLKCRLTILHVYNPRRTMYREAQHLLQSFFAEADNYPNCDRVLISGDPAAGIAGFCQNLRDALLLLPPSDQAGLPRPWHSSLRAQMIERLNLPIWTLGRTLVGEPMPTTARHVAVYMASPEEGTSHLKHAAHYASSTGSTLHLLHVVPDINEGTLTHTLRSTAPLGASPAEMWLADMSASLLPSTNIEIHIAQGSPRRILPKLLRKTNAGMLLTSRHTAVQDTFFNPRINPIFRECNAGIITIPQLPAFQVGNGLHSLSPSLLKAS